MPIPRSSADYYRRQQQILATLLLAIRRTWRRMDPKASWSEQYADDGVGAQLLMLTAAAQTAAARDADVYIAAVLAELALVADASPGVAIPSAFAGITGDGIPLDSVLSLAVPRAGQVFNRQRTVSSAREEVERPEWVSDETWESLERERRVRFDADIARNAEAAAQYALADTGRWLETVAATAVIDAARGAESAATVARPQVNGYVRMLNPPSCSRCAILAGKFYRWNTGFLRHPHCDCRHIPANESMAGEMTVNPDAYFHSLTEAEQDKAFTKAGAQAIRDGADVGQVVNARKGMTWAGQSKTTVNAEGRVVNVTRRVAQRTEIGSGGVYTSTTGTTARGAANRAKTGRNLKARIMPESLYEVARDRDDAIRLLKLHGFILH